MNSSGTHAERAAMRDSIAHIPVVPGGNATGHVTMFQDDRQRLGLLRAAAVTGPASRMRFLYRPVLVVSSPEGAREILVEQGARFEKTPATRVLLRPLARDGLFTSEGELWKRQRRLMSPLFHATQLASYTAAMHSVTQHAVSKLRDGQSLDLARLMTRVTMGIVGATLFGAETFESADDLGEALTTTLKWVDDNLASNYLTLQMSLVAVLEKLRPRVPRFLENMQREMQDALRSPVMLPGSGSPELVAALRVLDTYIGKMIQDRRQNPPPEERLDLLTKLLFARDAEPSHAVLGGPTGGMSDDQVRDEAMTLFVAGHETTANALSWAFYLLARHPEAKARVQAEADAFTFGRDGSAFDPASLAYTTRVFKETLRLYPPLILLGRRSIEPFTLGNERFPAGVLIFVNSYGIHHHPGIWPDPERFDPDRFVPEHEATRHKGAWLPFGVGPRVCIGNSFALMEGPIVMATLLRSMNVDINPGRVIDPDAFATLRPKGGVPAVVVRRS